MTKKIETRLAIDIGGTFTDVVLDGPFGRVTRKVLTTVAQPEVGLMNGAKQLLATVNLDFSKVDVFIHGTTLATNAVLERKGAKTALIATAGFRDVLEVGSEGRYDQYDLQLTKPLPLIPRERRYTVAERIDAKGDVKLELDLAELAEIVNKLRKSLVESVAIAFLHSYANSEHERKAARFLAGQMPDLSITMSSDVCPEIREYERTSTAAANAYVKPLINGYLERMEAALTAAGFTGRLFLVTSGGGLTSIETAKRYPIRLVESGPAGGAIYAAQRARRLGDKRVVSFDMGGTTAKVCLIQDGEPVTANSFEVDRTHRFMKGSGLPLRIPAVELVEIGAGGGSIAGVDRLRRVTVGPQSAGSQPGPACYPGGGSGATVTDADLALGLLDPGAFAGGRVQLDPQAASRALDAAVGKKLGLSSKTAAFAITETVCESMASAVRVHAAERGEPIADYTMIAFGGAAPLHAAWVAEKVGIRKVVVPRNAGVGSAVGFLEAPISFELIRSKHVNLASVDPAEIGAFLDALAADTIALVKTEGAELVERCVAHMRYVGQGHEISVVLPDRSKPLTGTVLREWFEDLYGRLFTRFIPGAAIEVLSWSVTVSTTRKSVEPTALIWNIGEPSDAGVREVFDGTASKSIVVPAYNRSQMANGLTIRGPALIVEDETTTFITSRFSASIDGDGSIVMQRIAASEQAGETRNLNSAIHHQVLWNRLLALVEEQAQILIRTAFSPLVRACGDVSVGVFDLYGRMLAQAVTGTPGHVNTMAESVKHFLGRFPTTTMKPGDAYITNDPWLGTGHLNDFVVVTPCFHKDKCVALFACTSHLMDIGGLGAGTEAPDVFAEGLYIPLIKLIDAGTVNETLMAVIEANTRLPVDTIGDTYSLAACNDVGVRRLQETMTEFRLDDLSELADFILERSRQAVLKEIVSLPKGTWRNEMIVDGYNEPLTLRAALTINEDGIVVDFAGSAPAVIKGINVPLTYATAYTSFAISCAIADDIPNNAGSLSLLKVLAPEGCIVNARKPSPVGARHVIGQMLPDLVFGCLLQILPERIPAEGSSCMWNIALRGTFTVGERKGRNYSLTVTTSGGMGARFTKDGLSATAFPTGIQCMPIEIAETQIPFVFWRKELRIDSGGPGRTRGGLGQIIEVENADGTAFRLSAAFERVKNPARGRLGGENGGAGYVGLASGRPIAGKGLQTIEAGDRLVIHTPGGGGLGNPKERPAALIERDVFEGRLSQEAAARLYGHRDREAS
ncbi:hydantoinase B/oxoprolinase family protein [Bradyrhizobium guangxiense]|uniref:hydantoinase B/oxoprolinase family protein n=1 Tax=Bradyrhizobium guangxiense TaxID=1325115 RepID=UPI0013E8B048|nr:hydantoinase B/oxoprolinase family protein [Bradyrhizobium guangxiense]